MLIPNIVLKAGLTNQCAKDSPRYPLGGVRFSHTGKVAIAEATDGHTLIRVTWNNGPNEACDNNVVIPITNMKAASKFLPKRSDESVLLQAVGKDVSMESGDNGLKITPLEGKWPKTDEYGQLQKGATTIIRLNAKALSDLAKTLATFADTGDDHYAIDLHIKDDESPVQLVSVTKTNPTAVGCIWPLRRDDKK